MHTRLFFSMTSLTAREISRDFLSLFFSFAFPVMFMLMFGFISRPGAAPSMQVGVVVKTQGPDTEALVRQLTREPGLSVKMLKATEVDKALNSANVSSVVVISGAGSGLNVEIVDQQTANPFLHAAVKNSLATVMEPERAEKLQSRMKYTRLEANGNFATAFLIPGLTAMALMQLGLIGTANPVISARARGTLMHLTLTPLPKSTLVGAHVAVRLGIAALQIILLMGLAIFGFDLPVDGGLINVVLVHALGALMLISLGFFIAGIVPNEIAGGLIVMLLNFIMLGFGDIFFSTASVPGLNLLSAMMPITYLTDASRQLTVGATGRFPLSTDLAVLVGLTAVFLFLAVKTFKFGMKKP